MKLPVIANLLLLASAGCIEPTGSADEATDTAALDVAHGPELAPHNRLVQPGTGLLALEVTDDNYAIYQDGAQVYATALTAGAHRQRIADVPAGNTAFVYRVGKVAFVWTNPDRTTVNFGVSPLVIWSAATGAHQVATPSAVGTFATTTNRRGDHIVFPANSSPDGSIGDLVYATTDLSVQTTLVAGAQMGFAIGPCNPLAAFISDTDPVIEYCTSDPSTATISRWTAGARHDLVTDAFAPPSLAVDPDGERVLTLAAGSRNPILVDRHGTATTLANVSGRLPSFGPDGAIYYAERSAPVPAPAQLVRQAHGQPVVLADVQAFFLFAFGSRSLTAPFTSPDGRAFLIQDALDPNTGLGNVVRVDTRGGPAQTLDAAVTDGPFGPAFTASSRFALFAQPNPITFVGPMLAADCHGARAFSDPNGWSYLPAVGDVISYNDNTTLNANPLLITADLKTVDLSRRTLEPRLIAAQANATYFTSHDQTGIVYTTDGGQPGLYVDRAF